MRKLIFDRVLESAHAKLDFHGYKRGISALLESLRKHPKAALYLNEMNATLPPLMRHSSTVCLLSLLCGLRLDFYLVRERSRLAANVAQDVSNLGVAALLHDVGMLRLDEDVRERWDSERDEDDPDWRQHVIRGYEMVRGEIDPTAASAVLHHHQRFDGSGFPKMRSVGGEYRTLMGSGIHVFARIIAACEEFSRRRFEGEQPRPVVSVLNEMIYGDRNTFFDPVVMTALTNVAPPYGPGSIVRLSSGMPAVVTDWSPADPCRPEVMPMAELDETHEFDPIECEHRPRIDLRESEHLEIAEIDGVGVLEDNFYPGEGEQFDLAALNKRMDNRADEFERRAG